MGHYGSPECRLIENIYVKGESTNKSYGTACREKVSMGDDKINNIFKFF